MKFNKSECIVTSKEKEVLMKGSRSKDNFHIWISLPSSCLISKVGETKLRHQKLEEAIRGLPKLKIKEGKICGDFQIGK